MKVKKIKITFDKKRKLFQIKKKTIQEIRTKLNKLKKSKHMKLKINFNFINYLNNTTFNNSI